MKLMSEEFMMSRRASSGTVCVQENMQTLKMLV